MSARQRFVANGSSKPATKPACDPDGAESGDVAAPEKRDPPSLKDASNSPHNGRRMLHDSTQNGKNGSELDAAAPSRMQAPNSTLALAGIDKPLNISSLTRQKTKKGVDASNQNKKDRNLTMDRLKENDPVSRIRSPKLLPMSPRRLQNLSPPRPHLFAVSNATLLTEDHLVSPSSHEMQSSRSADVSSHYTLNRDQNYAQSSANLTGTSFSTTAHTLMNCFSPSAPRAFNQPLEPARREVFPMGRNSDTPLEQAHTFDPLSPPFPAQRRLSGGRSYDYEAPINLDGPDDEVNEPAQRKHGQHVLRRTTKRIDRHDVDEEAILMREDKRAKLDIQSNEHVDLSYDRGSRPSRSSTPVHRYQTPVPIDVHHRQSQPVHRIIAEPQGQKLLQLGEGNEALCRLLGVDLERYVSEHVEQYEAAKKRWTSCTIEEWRAGAEEMAGKFSNLVDFVKDHMSTKLALHASLHDKVAQHKVVLGERRSMLKNMQDKLVKDSGTVLGGALIGQYN